MFALTTDAAPGRPNEDFVIATTDIAVVVDGAGVPYGGCHHGVAWYAQQLGTQTIASLVAHPDLPLSTGLAAGIAAVTAMHWDTCDLNDPGTPCAAVGILRIGPTAVDTLALSDVSVVVDVGEAEPSVTCDLSIEEISGTEPDAVAGMRFGTADHTAALAALVARQTTTRNRTGGWWVAAANPVAAEHAQTATYSRKDLRRATVVSDGATRPVDQMGLHTWSDYLDLLDKLSPDGLIAHVRSIESGDPDGDRYPRTKRHDDASIAQWTSAAPRQPTVPGVPAVPAVP